ncbi:uncharacterized protein LTR77_006137 [Saxophila tyrrhenica]|uniref:Uncharacterized protein n=1 Tax=Saxophila tyrrhenica TaxID=1690608 RepID=A0AAV9P7W6_9PEZI|nr:hypothetical protein LTR77_006137 [Saxophila tyrrhenica]
MSFIVNWVSDKVEGYAKTGIQAGGTMAGNAVGGVGSLVEGAGRSTAGGVTGGVGSVANYINGYGDTIKRSMSADGPVSGGNKTAVKPSAPTAKPQSAQKALPSSQGAKKALPSAGGAPKGLPAASQKPSTPRPNTGSISKPTTASAKKPPTTNGAAPRSAPGGPPSKPPSAVSQPSSNPGKVTSSTAPSGKVKISAESRPKPAGAKTAARPSNAPSVKPKDPLGIEGKPQQGGQKGGGTKASAGDPLAIGNDIGSIGKKK